VFARGADMIVKSGSRTTRFNKINTYVRNYRFDSTSTSRELITPGELKITVSEISTQSSNDSITAQRITLDMVRNSLITGNIEIAAKQNIARIRGSIPGLIINGFDSEKLLNNDYSLDTIRASNANIRINTIDTTESKTEQNEVDNLTNDAIRNLFRKSNELQYDTVFKVQNRYQPNDTTPESEKNIGFKKLIDKFSIRTKEETPSPAPVVHEDSIILVTLHRKATPTHGIIKHIDLSNSKLNWIKNGEPQKLVTDINFSVKAEELILDSINEFNVFNHLTDFSIQVSNYDYKLPDSLNIISFDKIRLSTRDESIKASGVALIPRVNKYDYANVKGYEVSWQHLHDLDLDIRSIDFQKLITEQKVRFRKVKASNGVLDLFKDKELEIPADQYKPMPQEALKKLKIPIVIDSIEVENFRVNYSSRLSSVEPEGYLEVHEINGIMTNVVNTDSAIRMNPYTQISASAKLGKGLLTADFNFDMLDENNRFIFDAHLSEMDANEFNSLLEATAYVKVSSGKVKDITLEAAGDDYYAMGNMRFVYNDLKVATVSRKNLKTKGMGNVIRSFFANSFVVKKNNPSIRFFPREGAMYYERDTQKIIIDYATKTALSGIVSSIGGRNARKDIKKMQKEDQKKKDEERKAAKRAARRISGA
ncbi:MAG: hypothetical protein ABFS32_18285, partial [Bacteroidota bacterium]